MTDKTEPGATAPKQAKPVAAKAAGIIVYNKNLNTWRAINSAKRLVLTGSKATLSAKFPTFIVKE